MLLAKLLFDNNVVLDTCQLDGSYFFQLKDRESDIYCSFMVDEDYPISVFINEFILPAITAINNEREKYITSCD